MIGDRQRQQLLKLAQERAQEHPVELEWALQQGMSAFRRRVALTYTATFAMVVAVAILLGASVAAIGRDHAEGPDKVTLKSLAVKPLDHVLVPGETKRFAAIATFSDDSILRVTGKVKWSSNSPIITINERGRASAVSVGKATITARWGSLTGSADVTVTRAGASLRSISVNPAKQELQPDETQEFSAVGTYSDGTSRDITRKVNWNTSDPAVLKLDGVGRATALAPGRSTIVALLGKRRGEANVRVAATGIALLKITIKPSRLALRQGEQTTFVATGHYSNNTFRVISREVDWTSVNRKAIQIDQNGHASAISGGTTTITAMLGTKSASAHVTVSARLTRVEVSPKTNEWCNDSATQQLTATATYSDGRTEHLDGDQVRWSSSNPAVATVNTTGLVSSPPDKTDDSASITAQFEGFEDVAEFSCTPVE